MAATPWEPNASYVVGQLVTKGGVTYERTEGGIGGIPGVNRQWTTPPRVEQPGAPLVAWTNCTLEPNVESKFVRAEAMLSQDGQVHLRGEVRATSGKEVAINVAFMKLPAAIVTLLTQDAFIDTFEWKNEGQRRLTVSHSTGAVACEDMPLESVSGVSLEGLNFRGF